MCALVWKNSFSRAHTRSADGVLGVLAKCACLCVGAGESYLCCHEYVIKPPLRKDDVPRQGVHEAGSRALFVSAESLLCALSHIESARAREGDGKGKHREMEDW